MPSTRTAGRAVGALAALAFVGVAAAQYSDPRASLDLTTRIGVQFAVGFVINLLLGGALVALSPGYADDKLDQFSSDPGETIVWGLIVGIGVPIVLVILAFTIIGLVITIPGILILAGVGIVGSAVMVVVVGDVVTDGGAGGTTVLVGALVLALLTAIPFVGGLINWLVGLPGIGMVGHDLYRGWKN
ncbi:hypothetical protein [Halobaculum magnesiiphilum]|uniref:DUF8173 domain-containing protein n=1 Tax=Halobaculum magnesiiphilum TaxID=1017351 RepID=A0A8T8WEU9_9EURY|nr:hypothetical protein [Halobaculum magnesiiphilum]QZP38389.1 hypothetical protein K6T50_04410 [Halobaculum magnesiiphilum]